MPPDTDPLIQNNDEKTHTNENLDSAITSPSQRQELADSMTAFFQEEDQKSGLPDSPDPEPAEKSPPKSKETKEPRKKSKLENIPRVEDEPDIDQIEAPKNASPATQSQFKTLKTIAKKFGTESKVFRRKSAAWLEDAGLTLPEDPEELDQVLDQFGEKIKAWKQGQAAPEIQQELEDSRAKLRQIDLWDDPQWVREYSQPTNNAYVDCMLDIAQYFEGTKEEIQESFLDPLFTKFKPSSPELNSAWFEGQLDLAHCSETDKHRLRQKFNAYKDLSKIEQQKGQELVKDKVSFDQWRRNNQAKAAQTWEADVKDETMKFVKERHPDWEEDIQKNTPRGQALQKPFMEFVTSLGDARGVARRGAEWVEMLEERTENRARISELEKEVKRLKGNVTTTRKVSDAAYRGGNWTGKATVPLSLPKSGSKSLQEAFDKHDWDGTRK